VHAGSLAAVLVTDDHRGRERTLSDAPRGFVRRRPAEVLDLIDAALEEHAASLVPRPSRSTWSESVRPRD
jgi:hypothetical protein